MEDDRFFLGRLPGLFSGVEMGWVSFREVPKISPNIIKSDLLIFGRKTMFYSFIFWKPKNSRFKICSCTGYREVHENIAFISTKSLWASVYLVDVFVSGWCSTPSQFLMCSLFSKKNGHLLLICSSLSTSQLYAMNKTSRLTNQDVKRISRDALEMFPQWSLEMIE